MCPGLVEVIEFGGNSDRFVTKAETSIISLGKIIDYRDYVYVYVNSSIIYGKMFLCTDLSEGESFVPGNIFAIVYDCTEDVANFGKISSYLQCTCRLL